MFRKLINRLFGQEQRAFGDGWNLENPANPLNPGDDIFGGRGTTSGVRVTHQTALRIPAFWQGVSKLSGDVSKVSLKLYRSQGDKDRVEAKEHPAFHLTRYQANEDQTSRQFFRQMMVNALVWSNAYALIERNGRGEAMGLLPLLPDRTIPRVIDNRKVYETQINNKPFFYDRYDVWHLKGLSIDGCLGADMVMFMRNAIGKILAREGFASRFYKSGGRVGGILQLPWTNDKTKRDKLESNFRKQYENPNESFKTVVLRENAKFHAAQASFRDTQMIEAEEADVRTVARMLNMPASMLGDDSRTSYNSLEAERQAYNANTLSHWFCEIEDECWLKFLTKSTRKAQTHFFEHTIGALLWADSKTVAEIGSKGVMSSWLLPNEPRHWFNLPTLPDGDTRLIPSGMTEAGAEPQEQDEPPATEEQQEQMRAAVNGLIEQTTNRFSQRLQRQAVKHDKAGTEWPIDNNLGVGREMFAQAQKMEKALFGETRDYAAEIIARYKPEVVK